MLVFREVKNSKPRNRNINVIGRTSPTWLHLCITIEDIFLEMLQIFCRRALRLVCKRKYR